MVRNHLALGAGFFLLCSLMKVSATVCLQTESKAEKAQRELEQNFLWQLIDRYKKTLQRVDDESTGTVE